MPPPSAAPASNASVHATAGGNPRPLISVAMKIDVKPMTAPIDKSIPPEKITRVIPIAAIPRKALSANRPTITRAEKNPLYETAVAPNSVTRIIAVTISGRCGPRRSVLAGLMIARICGLAMRLWEGPWSPSAPPEAGKLHAPTHDMRQQVGA